MTDIQFNNAHEQGFHVYASRDHLVDLCLCIPPEADPGIMSKYIVGKNKKLLTLDRRVDVIRIMCLWHYATSQKAADSIPDEVIGFVQFSLIFSISVTCHEVLTVKLI
jgi:hypothetical protein